MNSILLWIVVVYYATTTVFSWIWLLIGIWENKFEFLMNWLCPGWMPYRFVKFIYDLMDDL